MRTNIHSTRNAPRTHEGAVSTALSPAAELRRTVMANMLFEDTFYESGEDGAARMKALAAKVSFPELASIAIDAREKMKLRHVPLFVLREAIRIHKGRQVGDLIARVIQRPDEMAELVSLYWKDNPNAGLTSQMKIGLARAMKKFTPYQLAKWNKDGPVKLRDVLFLAHVRPRDGEQKVVLDQIASKTLPVPDTWEVALSEGADKKATWERLMREGKLGGMALLRNLRNMDQAKVDQALLRAAIGSMNGERILPFRFITAAKYAPQHEDVIEKAMFNCLKAQPRFPGNTALLVDHSGSMQQAVSAKSEVTRFDAASALAMILRETADRARIFTFAASCIEIPPRSGFGMLAAMRAVINPTSTLLGAAVKHIYKVYPECNRIIVVTDEQSADRPPHPQGTGYIINVGGYKQGIGYGPWVTIDGWSEAVLDYIRAYEGQEVAPEPEAA